MNPDPGWFLLDLGYQWNVWHKKYEIQKRRLANYLRKILNGILNNFHRLGPRAQIKKPDPHLVPRHFPLYPCSTLMKNLRPVKFKSICKFFIVFLYFIQTQDCLGYLKDKNLSEFILTKYIFLRRPKKVLYVFHKE